MISIIGQKFYNNFDEVAVVIEYNGNRNIKIKSTKDYEKVVTKAQLKNKSWKTPYAISSHGKGYIGEGIYSSRNKHGDKTIEYKIWNGILERCYGNHPERHKSYVGCNVCDEWLCFQNFAQWYSENLWNCDEALAIDKDILLKGNKTYSPENCILVPSKINSIFTKSEAIRGDYYIGVEPRSNNKFRGVFNIQILEPNKRKYSKFYDTPEEAFEWYKEAKEKYIKDVADLYKAKYSEFPQTMYHYEVEITD